MIPWEIWTYDFEEEQAHPIKACCFVRPRNSSDSLLISAFQFSAFELLLEVAPAEQAFAIRKEGEPHEDYQGDQPHPR